MDQVFEESYGIIPLVHKNGDWKVFIILHKHGNHWSFPKGHPDEGEEPIESAIRELKEETNLKVEKLLEKEPMEESYTFVHNNKKVQKTVAYFPAIVSGALLLQPEEIRDGKWVDFEEALSTLTFEEAKRICRRVQESLIDYQ